MRAPNQEGQRETEVLEMGSGMWGGRGAGARAGCDRGRGAREGWTRAKGWGSSNLGFMWGRRPKSGVHKTGVTSQCAGSTSRRALEFIGQRCDVVTNVAM